MHNHARNIIFYLLVINIFLFSIGVKASPGALNFQAQIRKPDGRPLEAGDVSFRFKYLNEAGTCTVYIEDFSNVSMVGSAGVINIKMGSGVRYFPSVGPTNLFDTFSNRLTNSMDCWEHPGVSPYAPLSNNENRKLKVEFAYTGSGGVQSLNGIEINSVPYSMYATEAVNAERLGGSAANLFAKFSDFDVCPAGQFLRYDGSHFYCDQPGNFTGSLSGDVTGTQNATSVTGLRGVPLAITAPTLNQILQFDGTNWVPTTPAFGGGSVTNVTSANTDISVATGTSTPHLTLNSGTGANQILKLNGTAQIPAVDGSLLTNLDIGQIATGILPIARGGTNAGTANGALNNLLPTQTPHAGKFLQTDGTNTSWVLGNTGTVTNVTGTLPISVATGTSTPVISIATANTTTTGALSSADWNTFNSKQAAGSYITALTGDVTAAGPGSSVATIANLAVTDAKINDVAFSKITGLPTALAGYGITDAVRNVGVGAGNVITSMQSGNTAGRPVFGTDGRLYLDTQAGVIYRDSGSAWIAVASTGAGGTVTNVTSANTDISVATGTSTPHLTLNSGTGANQILKLNGTAQIPAVDGSLLTNLDIGQIATGILPIARGGTNAGTANGALNNLLPTQTPHAGKFLQTDGTNTSWVLGNAGTVTNVTGTLPISVATGTSTPVISMAAATAAVDGYLTAANFTIFNNKLGTASTFSGDVSGTSSTMSVDKIKNRNIAATAPTNGQVLTWNNGTTQWEPQTISAGSGTVTSVTSANADISVATTTTTPVLTLNSGATGGAGDANKIAKLSAAGLIPNAMLPASATYWQSATGGINTTAGSVGINQGTPRATLDINGSVAHKAATSNATATINFGTGNLQYTSQNCQTYALHNLKDGGSYSFAILGTTLSTCIFNAFSDAGVTPLVMNMPPDHGTTASGKKTMYHFLVMGTNVFVSWIPGY